MMHTLLSGGYGGGSFLSFRKSLYLEVRKTQSSLTGYFHEMFNRLSFFEKFLGTQSGAAVTALKSNLGNHMRFLSESAPVILYFIDTTESVLYTLEASDVGDNSVKNPIERQAWAYEYSLDHREDRVDINPDSLAAEASLLKGNFEKISEILTDFNTMIENVLSYTTIPWGEFSSIWSEAKHVCENIVTEMDKQINVLIEKTDVLIEEMVRVDHYLGNAMEV